MCICQFNLKDHCTFEGLSLNTLEAFYTGQVELKINNRILVTILKRMKLNFFSMLHKINAYNRLLKVSRKPQNLIIWEDWYPGRNIPGCLLIGKTTVVRPSRSN